MVIRYVLMGLMACVSLMQARAQESLPDLVSQANADWMLGQWQAQTDNGGTFNLGIAWELDKHAVAFHGKDSNMEFKGFNVIEPGSDKVKYWGVDNHGVVAKGSWAMEDDQLTLRIDCLMPEGGTRKMAVVFGGSADEGLKIRIYGVNEDGELVTPAHATLSFKKK